MDTSTITLLSFGIAAEITGARLMQRPLGAITRASELRRALLMEYPAFQDIASIRIAINQEYALDDTPVRAGDEVAIIPPVSGG